MKRIKVFSALLILLLCFTILGVGIYAASPAVNTISGNITVAGANAEVEIVVATYDGTTETQRDTATTRKGKSNLTYVGLSFDASQANTVSDVASQEIRI